MPDDAPQKRTPLRDAINQWWDRLLMVAESRSVSDQARLYAADETRADYLWNTLGQALWGALFPLLSIVATQLSGADGAGMFSMAFTVATLLLCVGNYGVRTYQVSDIDEMDSFAAYQVQRIMACVAMVAIGLLYGMIRGYDAQMSLIVAGALGFRAVDALADVFEGRLQQVGKLYLSGISIAVRSALGVIGFTLLLLITHKLAIASVGMAIIALVSLMLLTIPLAYLETPKSRSMELIELQELFVECFPAMAATFLFTLIEAVPKFAMEGVLPYSDQVYFSAIYFPAQAILMIVGFVYKPQLVRLASMWADGSKRGRFDIVVLAMLAVCAGVTLVMLAVFGTVGVPLNSLLYATDFEPMRSAQYIMIVAGGMSAAIEFLFQILTVLREQALATRLYLAAFALVAVAAVVLVRIMGFAGAVWSYLLVMTVLLALLAVCYIRLRIGR